MPEAQPATYALHALVREVYRETEKSSPHDIAAEVAARVPDEDLRAALAMALSSYVSSYVTRERSRELSPISPAQARQIESRPSRNLAVPPAPPLVGKPTGRAAVAAHSSRKVASIRALDEVLAVRICAGPGLWLRLSECTSAHLKYAAEVSDALAVAHSVSRDRYRSWAKLLEDHGAEHLSDLPNKVLAPAMGVSLALAAG